MAWGICLWALHQVRMEVIHIVVVHPPLLLLCAVVVSSQEMENANHAVVQGE